MVRLEHLFFDISKARILYGEAISLICSEF